MVIKDANSPANEELLVFCRQKVNRTRENSNGKTLTGKRVLKNTLSAKKLKNYMVEGLQHTLRLTKQLIVMCGVYVLLKRPKSG